MLDYHDADLEAKKAIAAALDTPADVLQQLSRDSNASVRSLVASNPNTPTEILLKLGEEFPELITANPIFSILLLENPENRFVRLSLARCLNTSEETLAKLSQTWDAKDADICSAIAKHPNTPIHILENLAVWSSKTYQYYDGECLEYRVHKGVALNIKTPLYLLEKLVNHISIDVLIAVAKNPNNSPKTLEKLAKERDPEVLQAVANHPQTPVFLLEQLAAEDKVEIRQAVLSNPNVSTTAVEIVQFIERKPGTPIYILERLASDSRIHVRQLVANHPYTNFEILLNLAKDESNTVRTTLAKRADLSGAIIEKLIDTTLNQIEMKGKESYMEHTILFQVARNANTPFSLLEKLAFNLSDEICNNLSSNFHYLQEAIAYNVNTPISALEKMANDCHAIPKQAARKTLDSKLGIQNKG